MFIIQISNNCSIITKGSHDMTREDMIEYIKKKLGRATDREVEIIYGLLLGLLGQQ